MRRSRRRTARHRPFTGTPERPRVTAVDLTDLLGFHVLDEDEDDDDPVLVVRTGAAVDTWREGYPCSARMDRDGYEAQKRLLQIELLKLQKWVKAEGRRLEILFEGRDAAGESGTIKRFT